MDIEQEIFASYHLEKDKLLNYGFESLENIFIYSKNFLNGEFKAQIVVDINGEVSGKVIENAFNEEFLQLRIESFHGGFVGEVREAYKEILIDIRDKCFKKEIFVSNQANRLAKLIKEKYGESPDFPFTDSKYKHLGVFRYQENKKWYGLVMNVNKSVFGEEYKDIYIDVINVRIDENKRNLIINNKNIFPSYHMNKMKWVSILLDESLADFEVMNYIDYSRNFMINKTIKKRKKDRHNVSID